MTKNQFVRLVSSLPILLALTATAWFGAANAFPNYAQGTTEQIQAIRPPAEGTPGALAERHGCWTGEAPADMQGVFPGHVIVSTPGEGPRYAGKAMAGKALEQLFDGQDHGLTIHAFCR